MIHVLSLFQRNSPMNQTTNYRIVMWGETGSLQGYSEWMPPTLCEARKGSNMTQSITTYIIKDELYCICVFESLLLVK